MLKALRKFGILQIFNILESKTFTFKSVAPTWQIKQISLDQCEPFLTQCSISIPLNTL